MNVQTNPAISGVQPPPMPRTLAETGLSMVMMRDILLEIGQRGNEALDPQSVPLAMRRRATQLASESGLSGLKQCAVDELHLNEAGITLVCKGEHTATSSRASASARPA